MPVLELASVSKSYGNGRRPAVDRVSLRVEDGELLVLVGPSGCGKSSLLRMIAGLEEISGGEIKLDGRVVNELPPKTRDMAMVFQNYALYPHMTVYKNMAFGLELRKQPRAEIERIVRETASILGLEPLLERRPRELSGGERQRVALGRAMVRKPSVFLFDEPLSNLDARLRVQMRGEIHRLHRQLSATMVYVTHDQVEAMTLGDRIAVLDQGVLQQVADPFTLYQRPANRFVAGFIGSPPMNFLTAAVAADGMVSLAGGEGFRPRPAPPELAARGGRQVTLGIRPEDLVLVQGGVGSEAATIAAILDVQEPLGNETILYWSTAAGSLVSRIAGAPGLELGAAARLGFAFDRIRWFDAESGKALEPTEGSASA